MDVARIISSSGISAITTRTSCIEMSRLVQRAAGLAAVFRVKPARVRAAAYRIIRKRTGLAIPQTRAIVEGLLRERAARRWYVAWHPSKVEGVLRHKDEAGLAAWRARDWDFFRPHQPAITDVTDRIPAMLDELDALSDSPVVHVFFDPRNGRVFASELRCDAAIDLSTKVEQEIPHVRFTRVEGAI